MTTTVTVQEQLLGHLLGALDETEQELVTARLEDDKDYRRELARLLKRTGPLLELREEYSPPPGLADRTCRVVAERRDRPARTPRCGRMTPDASPPNRKGRIRRLDVVAAACIFLAAGLLMMPAIQNSRFQSRLIVCQNNLRELGRALTDYSDRHGDYFPKIPSQGPMAAAGVYAPVLLQEGFLGNARRVVCPDSPLARQDEFTVPSLEQLRAATPGELAVMRQEMGGSYGYHLGHVQDGKYQATRNLRRGTFALMADAPNRSLTGRQSTHHAGRGQNVLFEDGHVQFVTCSKPIAAGDDIFSNDNGLIAAGLHRDDAVIGSSADPPIFYVGGL